MTARRRKKKRRGRRTEWERDDSDKGF